ncbi:MAG: prepilin peptidase [Solirubrobacterales bacterium]|nr:prepilin peptidase [Solirubrobacterales bacterium]
MPALTLTILLAAAGGLCLGSFLNVVVHRLPAGVSLVRPGSACTHCAAPIRPHDNVPVVSWLLLGGRCRSCRGGIPVRYPAVEALTAMLFAAVVLARHADRTTWLAIVFVAALVPIAVIDLEHRIIPNRITLPAAVAALLAGVILDPGFVPEQLIAGAAAFGFFFLAALAYPRGMGMGDVKLAGVLGLYLGRAVGPGLFIALIAGVVVGVAVIARKGAKEGRKTAVPFGPFLALGGMIAFFVGQSLADDYANSF